MTGQEPKMPKAPRRERLDSIISKKEQKISALEFNKTFEVENLESITSGGARELFSGDREEIDKAKQFKKGLEGLLDLCDEIVANQDPQGYIRRMFDYISQRGDAEWLRTEAGDDARFIFFYMYDSVRARKAGEVTLNKGSSETHDQQFTRIAEYIREHRNDAVFVEEVVHALPDIVQEFETHLMMAKGDIRKYQRSERKAGQSVTRISGTHEERIKELDAHIARTKAQIRRFQQVRDSE